MLSHLKILCLILLFLNLFVQVCLKGSADPSQIHIPLGSKHEPLPIAFILFTNPGDAVRAFKTLDGTDLQGRLMHIIPGDQKRVSQEDDPEGKTLKQRREIERRKQTGRGIDWGTLFMNVRPLSPQNLSSTARCGSILSRGTTWCHKVRSAPG